MEAIRQILSVKNHSVTVILPDNFTADEVEVIILPVQNDYYTNAHRQNYVRSLHILNHKLKPSKHKTAPSNNNLAFVATLLVGLFVQKK